MALQIVALVPMRHHSERVPGKNYRLFAGQPLFHRIVETLQQCPSISQIYLDTDSPCILESARTAFPTVGLLIRPPHLRDGHISMNAVLAHSVAQVPADLYLQTHCTNPLLQADTIERAIATLQTHPECDSLFAVTPRHTRFYWPDGRPVNHDPAALVRTQDLPPLLEENSNLYLFSPAVMTQCQRRIGRNPYLFPIPAAEAWDIDEELDWSIAEFLWHRQNEAKISPKSPN
ncbi:MAG: acylneuraminate cytidylyltransferase family protein [Oscillatoriales cyanobacterium SM2_1_8]|nr:acylneuraminate cytidylyltransferase family protein [Oscillatoriales cyanobacterium SM2_1_8]